MKVLALVLTLLLVVGCSPAQVKPFQSNSAASIDLLESIELEVREVPAKPEASVVTDVGGVEYAGFDTDGIDQLEHIIVVAEANTVALQEMESATNAIIKERNATVKLLDIEEKRANLMASQWADAENRRRHEEQAQSIRQTIYEFVIVLLVIATAI